MTAQSCSDKYKRSERRNNEKNKKAAALLTAAVLMLAACDGDEDIPVIIRETSPVSVSVDPASIRAQDDFYGYINAARLLEELPEYGQVSNGSFGDVEKQTREELFAMLDKICTGNEDYPAGSSAQIIRDT